MARVTGIGGFFFRARDPDGLSRWYAEHLDVVPTPRSYDDPVWSHEEGPTIFAPFPLDSDELGAPERTWKINFRVDDLDGMVQRLRSKGVTVEPHPEAYPNGRFAELEDPEGNRIQLWEFTAPSSARSSG